MSRPRTPRAAVIFAAAPLALTRRTSTLLAELVEPYVVAADGGAATALAFGFRPDVVVGDLDSIDAPVLAELRRRRIPIETHPRDKDATDGQLAVERALQVDPTCLWLLGFLGGPRLDQALAHLLYLTRLTTPAVLLDEQNECRLLRPEHALAWTPDPDEVISLLVVSPEVTGVQTHGLRWPLNNDRLRQGDTRGVSNEPNAPMVRVSIEHGQLLVTRHFPHPDEYKARLPAR